MVELNKYLFFLTFEVAKLILFGFWSCEWSTSTSVLQSFWHWHPSPPLLHTLPHPCIPHPMRSWDQKSNVRSHLKRKLLEMSSLAKCDMHTGIRTCEWIPTLSFPPFLVIALRGPLMNRLSNSRTIAFLLARTVSALNALSAQIRVVQYAVTWI